MDIPIDPGSHVPIYLQIVAGLRSAMASGALRPGESLPSLRTLGIELKVNPNTVQRAFDELEREGLIVARRGVGMYVAEPGDLGGLKGDEARVAAAFRRGIKAGRSSGITSERLRRLFDLAMESAGQGVGRRS